MSSTIKNLHDVEEVAPRFGFDSIQAVRFAARSTRAFEAWSDGLELLAFGPHHDGGWRDPGRRSLGTLTGHVKPAALLLNV
jgi:hypothetical protein